MDTGRTFTGTARRGVLAAVAATAMLVAPLAAASDDVFSYWYTGYGFDTATDTNDDGFPVNVTNAVGKGGGAALIAITAEFAPDLLGSVSCPEGYVLPFVLVYSSNVTTFTDRSQTTGFSFFDDGWLCLSGDRVSYVGAVRGFITGGTGRFAGATGTFESIFEGENIDPYFGFRTIRGETRSSLSTD